MKPITITLRQIEAHGPCSEGWETIQAATHLHGGDFDKPFPLSEALETNGLNDTLWALRCLPEHNSLWRKYAVWCARQVQHMMADRRSIDALDVAWRHSNGEATDDELRSARDAAWAAAWPAAGDAARDAARGAARDAARAVAWDAAWAAAGAAAWAAAGAAAGAAARDAAWAAQESKLRQILEAGEWVEDEQAELVEVE